MRYSQYFKVKSKDFEDRGVYNGLIGQDVPLHIDPLLLKGCKIPEFQNSYNSYFEYFKKFVPLAKHAQNKRRHDRFFKEMIRYFVFRELANTGLGYSIGKSKGSGISGNLSFQLACSAFDIIKAGFEDPEIFGLLPLFEDGIGADRISDMTIRILLPDFLMFTERISKELGIKTSQLTYKENEYWVPAYRRNALLFIPKSFLTHLPMPQCKMDVADACDYNDNLKRKISALIGIEWEKCKDYKKCDWRDLILSNRENFDKVVEFYRAAKGVPYNFDQDKKDLYTDVHINSIVEAFPMESFDAEQVKVLDIALKVCNQFKSLIELNRMWKVISRKSSPLEKDWQDIMFITAKAYVAGGGFDTHISREEDTGAGLTDFVFSRGALDKTVVEVKRSVNPDLLHGFRQQLPAYMKAIEAESGIFVVIFEEDTFEKVSTQLETVSKEMKDAGEYVPEIIFIDGRRRPSASKRA